MMQCSWTPARGISSRDSRRAELRGDGRFERGNNPGRVVGDLCVSESGFAALQGYANHQRIFSRWNALAAEEIGGFDRINLRNIQRTNGLGDFRECSAFSQQQREI